jgi:mannose-6-phosphate isomerase
VIALPPNQIRRFYRGGNRIAAFRGVPPTGDDAPEDWIASTTTVHGETELGLSRLDDGTLLAEAFAREPEAFFEPEHLSRFGPEPAVLLKLLDAGERLPVHLHPDDEFARAHLRAPCGKTEAWIILEAEPGARVHLGFAEEIDERTLAELVAAQEVLSALTPVPVSAGDWLFVPAGLPHAIGEGILLLELQQPADLSLLLEGREYLGLPEEVALRAVTRTVANLDALRSGPLPERFFRADLLIGDAQVEPGFSVLVCYEGRGELGSLPISRGATVLVPYADGAVELVGDCRVIRCRPPVPSP